MLSEELQPGVELTAAFQLPLLGDPPEQIKHTIPLEDVRRGCFRQDCIPSVDAPKFVAARDLSDVLEPNSLGIILHERIVLPFSDACERDCK